MSDEVSLGPVSIYRKIVAVYKDVNYIQKDKKNAFHNYTYASESAIKDHLHEAFAKHGLVMLPPEVVSIEDVEKTSDKGKKETVTTILIRFGIADMDSGESVSGTVYGRGVDSSDKGVYKAITGGLKYFLTTTFLIPTGDDPEAIQGSRAAQAEVLERKLVKAGMPPEQAQAEAEKLKEETPKRKSKGPTGVDIARFYAALKEAHKRLGDEIYYRILGSNGFCHMNEITTREEAERVWSDMQTELKALKAQDLGVSEADLSASEAM